jgi:hypothetical protein
MKIDRKGALAAPTHRVRVGPIASHIDGFAKFLADEGYARLTVTSKCLLVADHSQWLKRRRLPLAQLDERKLKQFYITPIIATRLGAAMCQPASSCWSCYAASESLRRYRKK